MTAVSTRRDRWLPFQVADAEVRLYCLPHAGGSASAFRPWSGRLAGVAVCPLQPPGRETRLQEKPFQHLAPMIDELADVLLEDADGPLAVYGHSLGGLVGFELMRELRRRGGSGVHLIVSGCPAPSDDSDDGPSVAGSTQEQLVRLLKALGGTPEWLLSDPTALRMILPPFRADFSVKETYRYSSEAPLDIPITAIASTRDIQVSAAAMAGWQAETSAAFELHTMIGGHFAVLEHPSMTLNYLSRALRPWSGILPMTLGA